MNITKALKKLFQNKEDAKPTTPKIEEKVEEDDVIAVYIPYFARTVEKTITSGLQLPLNRISSTVFHDVDELKEHIKDNSGHKDWYFFDRNDDEARKKVMDTFKEVERERLEKEKTAAEKKLEETEERLEELD